MRRFASTPPSRFLIGGLDEDVSTRIGLIPTEIGIAVTAVTFFGDFTHTAQTLSSQHTKIRLPSREKAKQDEKSRFGIVGDDACKLFIIQH